MSDFFTIITTVGQTKIAAAAAPGAPKLTLTHVAVGDGNGAPYIPNEAQTALLREKWRAEANEVYSQGEGELVVELVIPANENDASSRPSGGFAIREVGVFDEDGDLIIIAKSPEQYKPLPASGASADLTVRTVVALGNNVGVVEVTVVTNTAVPLNNHLRAPFIAVESATTTAPPGSPSLGDTYLVPHTGATGAWSGHADTLAQWTGTAWSFTDPPEKTIVGVKGGQYRVKKSSGWAAIDIGDRYAVAGGTANALTATLDPPSDALFAGMEVALKIVTTNTSSVTLNVDGHGAVAVVRDESGAALKANDLVVGAVPVVVFDGVNWRLRDLPSIGVRGFRNFVRFTASGSWTVPAGVTRAYVECIGGGASGGAGATNGAGGGGGGGGMDADFVDVTPGASITITVGAAGLGGGANGQNGGSSSFGASLTATGGSGGGQAGGSGGAGSGGVGGGGTAGAFQKSGAQGDPGFATTTGVGSYAGRGGDAADGGGAGGGGQGAGGPALGPGGGGGGRAGTGNGSDGFRGEVRVWW